HVRGIATHISLILLGLTACGPSLLERRMEISKVTPGDCSRADALVEEYAGAGALPSDVRTVRAQVNALCGSAAYTQGDLGQAETRAQHALGDEPDNALAQDTLSRITKRRPTGPLSPTPSSP